MVNFPAIALLGATLVLAAPRGWDDWSDKGETTSTVVSVPPTTTRAVFTTTSDPLPWSDWGDDETTAASSRSTKLTTTSKTSSKTSSKTTSTSKQSTTSSAVSNGGWSDWSGNRPQRPGPGGNNGNNNGSPASIVGDVPYVKPTTVQGNGANQGWAASSATQTLSAPWAKQSAMFVQEAPTATLKPTLHWDHRPRDLNHIVPGDNQKIYFAGGQISEFQ